MKGNKTDNDPQSWAVWCHHREALKLTNLLTAQLAKANLYHGREFGNTIHAKVRDILGSDHAVS